MERKKRRLPTGEIYYRRQIDGRITRVSRLEDGTYSLECRLNACVDWTIYQSEEAALRAARAFLKVD